MMRQKSKRILKITLIVAFVLFNFYQAIPASAGTNFWSSNGPDGGFISALAINPLTPATLFAGTDNGIFRSTDGGSTWKETSDGMGHMVIKNLVIDPVTPSILYAGTESGVYKSINDGEFWSLFKTGLTDPNISALAIDPSTPTTLYAGTLLSGVFKSTTAAGIGARSTAA